DELGPCPRHCVVLLLPTTPISLSQTTQAVVVCPTIYQVVISPHARAVWERLDSIRRGIAVTSSVRRDRSRLPHPHRHRRRLPLHYRAPSTASVSRRRCSQAGLRLGTPF